MVNKERLEKWVAALETQPERQVKGSYIRGDGMCAVGVGIDVFLQETQGKRLTTVRSLAGSPFVCAVQQWYGIDQLHLRVQNPERDCKTSISVLNDHGVTFPEIAQLIRKEYL